MTEFMTDVMAFGVHPDDIEFGCGGIMAKLAAQGKSLVFVDLTLGEKGTNGTPEIRRQEALNAAKVLGAKRVFLDFIDCEVFDTYEGRLKLTKVIREHKPKLVIGPLWKGERNHPDHLACGLMLRYACRYARFSKILPDISPHTVGGILHYVNGAHEPDFLIDISDHIENWKKMMECHQSQLKTFNYIDWVLRAASAYGITIDKPYAQGLAKGNPVQVDDLMSVSKGIRNL